MLSTRALQRLRITLIRYGMPEDRWPALHRLKRNFKAKQETRSDSVSGLRTGDGNRISGLTH